MIDKHMTRREMIKGTVAMAAVGAGVSAFGNTVSAPSVREIFHHHDAWLGDKVLVLRTYQPDVKVEINSPAVIVEYGRVEVELFALSKDCMLDCRGRPVSALVRYDDHQRPVFGFVVTDKYKVRETEALLDLNAYSRI